MGNSFQSGAVGVGSWGAGEAAERASGRERSSLEQGVRAGLSASHPVGAVVDAYCNVAEFIGGTTLQMREEAASQVRDQGGDEDAQQFAADMSDPFISFREANRFAQIRSERHKRS